jgi:hypothetical protein
MNHTMIIALRLAREGFGGGDPERILAMRADLVLDAWEYINFQADYEETVAELNKGNP